MPNWCENVLLVEGDRQAIDVWNQRLRSNKGSPLGLLSVFVPAKYEQPDESDWYEAHCSSWGTKWDVPFDTVHEEIIESNCNRYLFETAWSPPLPWLESMAKDWPELNFVLFFEEPNMQFMGVAHLEDGELNVIDRNYPDLPENFNWEDEELVNAWYEDIARRRDELMDVIPLAYERAMYDED